MRCKSLITLLIVAGFALASAGVASVASAETLDDFAGRVKTALAGEDKPGEDKPGDDKKSAAKSLFNLQGMDAEVIAMYDRLMIPMLTRRTAETITFEDLPADFRAEYVQQGYEYRPNLKPLGYLVLNGKTRVPYGKIDERYYIAGTSRTQANPDPPPEQTVQVNVFGFSTPPVRYSGSCDFLQSYGKLLTMQIQDNGLGNNTMAMNAVHIETCSVTKLSGNGPLTMRVLEADVVLFEQQVTDIGVELTFSR